MSFIGQFTTKLHQIGGNDNIVAESLLPPDIYAIYYLFIV